MEKRAEQAYAAVVLRGFQRGWHRSASALIVWLVSCSVRDLEYLREGPEGGAHEGGAGGAATGGAGNGKHE